MALWFWDEMQNLANSGGYGGMATLSPLSAAILLSALPYINKYYLWTNTTGDLSNTDKDDLDNAIAQTIFEIEIGMIGVVLPFASTLVPAGCLLCDGTQYARVDYPELWAALDTAFIDDADYFTVPNLSDKFIYGTGANNPGDVGGNSAITLGIGDLPPHDHLYNQHTLTPITIGAGAPVLAYTPPDIPTNTSQTGSGNSINILNPYLVLGYAIVAGR